MGLSYLFYEPEDRRVPYVKWRFESDTSGSSLPSPLLTVSSLWLKFLLKSYRQDKRTEETVESYEYNLLRRAW